MRIFGFWSGLVALGLGVFLTLFGQVWAMALSALSASLSAHIYCND